MSLQKTVFGRLKIKPNTFIGGVGATINTAALAASKLGISASRIKAFSVIGDNIQFAVTGGNYTLPASAFDGNVDITYYNDDAGKCVFIGDYAFRNSTLNACNFPEVTNIGTNSFQSVDFTSDVSFPKWVSSSNSGSSGAFANAKFTNFYASGMISLSNANHFDVCRVTGEMVFSSLTTIGTSTSSSSNAFRNLTGGGVLKVPVALATVNSGSPDPDLGSVGNNVTVYYIGYIDDGSYNTEININESFNKLTIANKIGCKNAYIFNYSQVGNLIRFKYSGENYNLPASAFDGNINIISYNDDAGKCVFIGDYAFRNSTLNACNFPEVTNIRTNSFKGVIFTSDVSFPKWVSSSSASASGAFPNAKFTNFYASGMINISSAKHFQYCQITGEMVFSSLNNIGSSVSTSNGVFEGLTGGGVLKVPAALATVNSGSPDPDITPAIMGVSVSLEYI